MNRWRPRIGALLALFLFQATGSTHAAEAPDDTLPSYLKDRGTGIPSSMFNTYIERGQLLVFPFYAYSKDDNREYQPKQLGFGLAEDFRGRFRGSEGLLFMAYGVSDRAALEFEAGTMHSTLEKSGSDPSATPAKIDESGIGDIEGQLRWRWLEEGEGHPEIFSYLEVTVPSQRHKLLIADKDWDFKPGIGVVRGFSWGTVTTRVTVEYNHDDTHMDLGEFSIEYLKRLAQPLRTHLRFEGGETGAPDEWELIGGVQWRVSKSLFLKVDNSIGLSSKATDWAPQAGLMFSFHPGGISIDEDSKGEAP